MPLAVYNSDRAVCIRKTRRKVFWGTSYRTLDHSLPPSQRQSCHTLYSYYVAFSGHTRRTSCYPTLSWRLHVGYRHRGAGSLVNSRVGQPPFRGSLDEPQSNTWGGRYHGENHLTFSLAAPVTCIFGRRAFHTVFQNHQKTQSVDISAFRCHSSCYDITTSIGPSSLEE